MTRKKIIEDMKTRCKKADYKNWFCWTDDTYIYATDGKRMYRDIHMPIDEFTEEAPRSIENLFDDDKMIYGVEEGVTIDTEFLKIYLKVHRRPIEFIADDALIMLYKGIKIAINPWYLRDQLEYAKNNILFFMKERPDRNPIYTVCEDFNSVQCLTLPVVYKGSKEPDIIF